MRTQLMKGLFNYEKAYRTYTQACLEEFVKDNIQYAEIRPNFMETNQVWNDTGDGQFDNEKTLEFITDEYQKFQDTHKRAVLKGLKIIYCTPRSFAPKQIEKSLQECLEFKLSLKYRDFIAGEHFTHHPGYSAACKSD